MNTQNPTLIKMLHCHTVLIHWMEEAYRKRELAKLRTQMADIGIAVQMRVADGPQLLFCCMKADLKMKYPDVMIVMATDSAITPYTAYLTQIADVHRVGHFTTSWVFSRAGTKQMIKDGFNVDRLSEAFEDRE